MLESAMTRLSVLRLAKITVVAAVSWIGCTGDTSTGATAVPICVRYCDALEANCAGLEYKNRDECLKACAFMKEGNEGDADDTVGCRLAFAKAASKGDSAACRKASAYGGNSCGDPCATFCRMNDRICISGSDASPKPYTSESSCFEQCKTRPIAYDPNGDEGPQGFAGDDTLNCRMFHLLLSIDDQAGHCPHTAAVSETCRTR
jgi:hypothetical protein